MPLMMNMQMNMWAVLATDNEYAWMCCSRCCCLPVRQLTQRSTRVHTERYWVAIERPSVS